MSVTLHHEHIMVHWYIWHLDTDGVFRNGVEWQIWDHKGNLCPL